MRSHESDIRHGALGQPIGIHVRLAVAHFRAGSRTLDVPFSGGVERARAA